MIDKYTSKGIIVVLINFRVNIFAQWTTGTMNAPGNMELRDPIAALQWVQEEISAFGGDPGRVTVTGMSSGGMQTSLLTLIPQTEGLFAQALPMSGSSQGPISVSPITSLDGHKLLATLAGCNQERYWERNQPEKVLECMQKLDSKHLWSTYLTMAVLHPEVNLLRVDGPGGLIPEHPSILAQTRRPIATMLGTSAREMSFFLGAFDDSYEVSAFAASSCLLGSYGSPHVAKACMDFYNIPALRASHGEQDHGFWYQKWINISSDFMWIAPAFADADSLRKVHSPAVYLYEFNYPEPGWERFSPWHAMDLYYAFGFPVGPPGTFDKVTPGMRRMAEIYTDLVANFVKFGNPTPDIANLKLPQWEPLRGPTGFNYYSIHLKPKMKPFYHHDAMEFWNGIVPYLKKYPSSSSTAGFNLVDVIRSFNITQSLVARAVKTSVVGLQNYGVHLPFQNELLVQLGLDSAASPQLVARHQLSAQRDPASFHPAGGSGALVVGLTTGAVALAAVSGLVALVVRRRRRYASSSEMPIASSPFGTRLGSYGSEKLF
jgi:carboxylesterase type B